MDIPGVIIIEGHVQGLAITRALGKENIPVFVVDKGNCVARYSKYCKKFFKCASYNSIELVELLIELAKGYNLKNWLLFPTNDHAVYIISNHYEILSYYYKFTVPSYNLLQKIYDKEKLLKTALKCNVPIPATIFDNKVIQDEVIYPLLIKGKRGLDFYKVTGKKAFYIKDEETLFRNIKKIKRLKQENNYFLQEFIPLNNNKTASFTAFSVNGKIKTFWMGVKLREHPVRFGTATFCQSIYIEELIGHAQKLLEELKYTGICEIEFLKDPRNGEYKLIEINARTWLWVDLAINSGVNFPLLYYEYLNGKQIIWPNKYVVGKKWRNIFTDIIYSVIGILSNKLRIFDIIRQNRGEIKDAIWDKRDWKPFFIYIFLSFSFFKNR